MADEKVDESSATSAGSSKKLIILVVLAVAVLAGGGGAVWFLMGSSSDGESHGSEKTAQKDDHSKEPGPIKELDPFVLNLADREELRYLKMTIQLELDQAETETEFEMRVPAIRDALLVLLTSKESHHLRTVNGKRRIRDEIMSRANRLMHNGKITNVYFTDFIIQ